MMHTAERTVNVAREDLTLGHYDAWPTAPNRGRVAYTDPMRVSTVAVSPLAHHRAGLQYTATGYGPKIPTRYMVRYQDATDRYPRWRRVYVAIYSNAGTPYIIVDGTLRVIDGHTEHVLTTTV